MYEVGQEHAQMGQRAHLTAVQEAQQAGIIEVSGTASVPVSPDQAMVSFAVETNGPTAGDASEQNAEAMTTTVAAIRGSGVDGLEIETFGYSLRPDYGMLMQDGRQVRVIQGYTAVNNIRVRMNDVDAVGGLIDAGIGAGANRVAGLNFSASDTEGARHDALTQAVARARSEAEAIAAALGHELGVPLEVRGGAQLPQSRGDIMLMRSEAAATPIEAGDQTVTASVTIKFALGARRGGR
jgi:uncharacterized protein YggE